MGVARDGRHIDSPLEGWGTPPPWLSREPLNIHSNAYEAVRKVKTGPGFLYGFSVYNSGAAQFVQVFDKATAPVTGDVPAVVFTMAATANFGANWIPGRVFEYGCFIANSSTGPTYTAGSNDCFFDVQFL